MPINPIAVHRIKTVSLCGHSNADGWGASDKLFADTGDYASRAGGFPSDPTSAKVDPEDAWWKNIYVFTSPQPFPGTGHTPTTSEVGDGAWLEMTIANVRENGDPHPHAHPFNYPNVRGSCYPRYYYNAWIPEVFDGFHHTPSSVQTMGTLIGLETPFMQLFRNFHQEQVGLIKSAFSSTLFLPAEIGSAPEPWFDVDLGPALNTPASQQIGPLFVPSAVDPALGSQYAYWDPREQFDWSASTDRLFRMWLDKVEGAAAALPVITNDDGTQTQCKLDLQLLIFWFGDNDSLTRDADTLRSSFKDSVMALVKRVIAEIDANDWSSVPASEIPIVWPGIHFSYTNPDPTFDGPGFCNGVLQEIAEDNPRFLFVPSDAWTLLSAEGYETLGIFAPTHFSHTGYIEAAKDILDAYRVGGIQAFDAIADRDRMTLQEVMDEVRLAYDRGKSRSDVKDEPLIGYINQAARSIISHVGSLAWWLVQRRQIRLSFGSDGIASLPEHVAQVIRIEDPLNPQLNIEFKQIAFGDGGRCQIVVPGIGRNSAATYRIHCLSWPPRVSKAAQLVPIPRQISEWLIVETCLRIANAGTNLASQGLFAAMEQRVRTRCMKTIAEEAAGRQDRIQSGSSVIQLRY